MSEIIKCLICSRKLTETFGEDGPIKLRGVNAIVCSVCFNKIFEREPKPTELMRYFAGESTDE